MKEERLKNKNDGASEISSWVNKSRSLVDKKKVEKEKASHRLRILDEQVYIVLIFCFLEIINSRKILHCCLSQDAINEESDDDQLSAQSESNDSFFHDFCNRTPLIFFKSISLFLTFFFNCTSG